MPRRRPLLAFTLPLALVSLHAQDPVLLDPVEVTATRSPEHPSVRATTATRYSGDFLVTVGVSTHTDLAAFVPGLFISEQSVSNSSYNLRGITTDSGDPRTTQRVSVFQDGVPLSNNAGINVALFDLERIDVLKGPQPTAFGRAAQIGALSFVGNKARNETSTALTAGFGDFNARTASGYTNLPVVADKLFARVAFLIDEADGYVDNLASDEDLQGRDTLAFRASLRWQPTPQTTADLIVGFQHDTPPGIAFKSMVIPTRGNTNPFSAADLNRGRDLGGDREILSLTGHVTHSLNEKWTIASTTGWRDIDASEEFDADGSSYYALEAGEYTRARQFNQDVRLRFDSGDRLTASIGAGVFWEEASQRIPTRTNQQTMFLLLTGLTNPSLPTSYEESFTNHGETLAADLFGDVNYKLTPRLAIGASLRVSREKFTSGYESVPTSTPSIPILPTAGGGNSLFAPTGGLLETSHHATSWVGGINAAYELAPAHTLYTSVSRGRRPPSETFSQTAPFPINALAEEVVWNYEAGIKGFLASRRVAYDVAVFYYEYDHFQTQRVIAPPPAPSVATDGGRATGRGFEVTLQGAVNAHLSLFGVYGFTDAEFADKDEDGNPQAYAGNSFRLTARHVITLGATLTVPWDGVGTFFVTPSWTYKSKHFFEDDNQKSNGTLRQDGFGLVHLRAGYRSRDNRWEVVGWVGNLLDEDYLIEAGNIGANFGFPTSIRGAPRTFGLEATVRF